MFLDILNDRVILIFIAYFMAFPLIMLIPFYISLYLLKRKFLRVLSEQINSEVDQKLPEIANTIIGDIVNMNVDRLIDGSVHKNIEQRNSILLEKWKNIIVKNIAKLAYLNLRKVVSESLPSITNQQLEERLKEISTNEIGLIIERKLSELNKPSFQEIVTTEIKNHVSSLNITNFEGAKEYNEIKLGEMASGQVSSPLSNQIP